MPEEYKKIISEFATVVEFGESCTINNWKNVIQDVIKPVVLGV